jgi:hypothetical protein
VAIGDSGGGASELHCVGLLEEGGELGACPYEWRSLRGLQVPGEILGQIAEAGTNLEGREIGSIEAEAAFDIGTQYLRDPETVSLDRGGIDRGTPFDQGTGERR